MNIPDDSAGQLSRSVGLDARRTATALAMTGTVPGAAKTKPCGNWSSRRRN